MPLAGMAHAQSASSVCHAPTPTGPHGFVRLLDGALSDMKLEPKQTTAIEAIEKRAQASGEVLDEAARAVLLALADQIETGHVDLAALKSQLATYIAAREALSSTLRGALSGIHDVLDPVQRTRFAERLEQHLKQEAELYASPSWLNTWSSVLKLSDEQKQKIRGLFESAAPSLSAELQQLDKTLSAFKGERFSLAEIIPLKLDPLYALEGALRMVQTTSKITEILTPQQRAAAAKLLRDRVCGKADGGLPAHAYDYPYSEGFRMLR